MTTSPGQPGQPGQPGDPAPVDGAAFAAWIESLALAEAEAAALVLLAENGFPTDLTRAPTPAEVASRTSYAALEADVDSTTTEVVTALVAARAALLGATAAVLAGAVTIAEVLRRLDLTVAGVLALPEAFDVVADLQRTLRRLLGTLALRAARRLIHDAGRARVVPTDTRRVEDLLQLDSPDSLAGSVLEVQVSRLAADTASRAVRDVRDVAHRVAAATGTSGNAASTPGTASADPGRIGDPGVVTRFVDLVVADARSTPLPRAVVDSAHQGALAANGAGRTAAAAAYRRPSEVEEQRSGGSGPVAQQPDRRDVNQPADGTPRRALDPSDPNRDAARPDAGTPGGAGLGWVPEDGAWFHSSELLDRSTCSPCADVDGKEYASWADALADYPLGQYRLCEGGTRCRGTLVMVSARENPATLRTPYGR